MRIAVQLKVTVALTMVMDGMEKYRLNHEIGLDDGWNKNGDRKRRELTGTAEWSWELI